MSGLLHTRGEGAEGAELERMIAAARTGDRAAMEALLGALAPKLARFARRLCGPGSPEIDDALQDALLAVAQHLPQFEGRSSLSSWAFSLVRSACSHRRRGLKNQPADRLDEATPDAAPSPELDAASAERRRAVERALALLDDGEREVILLRDVEELSAEEAASALGISVAALKSRLHRARAALRERLIPIFAPSSLAPSAACPDVVAALSSKLEDDLAPEACTLLEAHVSSCAACDAVCESLKGALGICHQFGELPPTPEQEVGLRRAVRAAVAALGPVDPR